MNKIDMTSICFKQLFSFFSICSLFGFQSMLGISGNLRIIPMDQELGLCGSLLPHREDSIPELESLLAHVLNFKYFYRCIYTIFPVEGYAIDKDEKG